MPGTLDFKTLRMLQLLLLKNVRLSHSNIEVFMLGIEKVKLPLKFYLNTGVLEEKENMIDVNKKLRDTLESKGYEVKYEEFNSGHDYLCWGETLASGLISLIGNK